MAASNLSDETVVTGRGVALQPSSSGVAVVADIVVNKKSGKIVPKQLYVAIDPGLAVLIEEVVYDKKRVTSLDWSPTRSSDSRMRRK